MWTEIGKHASSEVIDKVSSTMTPFKYIAWGVVALIVTVVIAIVVLTVFTVV